MKCSVGISQAWPMKKSCCFIFIVCKKLLNPFQAQSPS
jgi:hypothetical protein